MEEREGKRFPQRAPLWKCGTRKPVGRFENHSKTEWNGSSGVEWPGWPGEIQALIVLRAAFAWTTFQRSAVFGRNSWKKKNWKKKTRNIF